MGYFLSKIESIPEDVECVFGIPKKRWMILDYGILNLLLKYLCGQEIVYCLLFVAFFSTMNYLKLSLDSLISVLDVGIHLKDIVLG